MPIRYRPTEVPDIPVEQLAPFFLEVKQDLVYYFSQIWAGWPIKATVGAGVCCLASLYTNFFYGNAVLVLLWLLLVTVDLLLGVGVALQRHKFTLVRLKKFVAKVFAHAVTIGIMGLLNHALSAAFGMEMPILNWFMCVLLCTEGASILVNMDKLGWPVPKIAHKIISKMDKKANAAIDDCLQISGDDNEQQD